MKVELENIRLGHSELTDHVFAGVKNNKGNMWAQKVDVTNDFIHAVISRWENQKETIQAGEDVWVITVKNLFVQK